MRHETHYLQGKGQGDGDREEKGCIEEANPFTEDLLRATVARAEDIVAYPAIYAVDQQADEPSDNDPSETVRGEVCSYIYPAVNDPSNE